MFSATFRNTVKTLLRSVTFWLVFVLFSAIVVRYGIQQVSYATFGTVYAPGYEPPAYLSLSSYNSVIDNLVHAGSLIYPLAILVVITTTLVLNRDHGDAFFEIEKAAGVSPSCYLLGRLCAVVAIAFAAQELLCYAVLHYLVLMQGGVEGMSLPSYLLDSFLRLTRTNLLTALPYILFYVGLTYTIGTVFKNGIAASCTGFIYAIVYFGTFLLYRHHISTLAMVYFQYLCPMPDKLRGYVASLGVEDPQRLLALYGTSLGKAMISIGFLVGVCVVGTVISYLLTRKRET